MRPVLQCRIEQSRKTPIATNCFVLHMCCTLLVSLPGVCAYLSRQMPCGRPNSPGHSVKTFSAGSRSRCVRLCHWTSPRLVYELVCVYEDTHLFTTAVLFYLSVGVWLKSEETVAMKTKRADFAAAYLRGRMIVAGGLGKWQTVVRQLLYTTDITQLTHKITTKHSCTQKQKQRVNCLLASAVHDCLRYKESHKSTRNEVI